MSMLTRSIAKYCIIGSGVIGLALIFSRILAPAFDFHGVYYPAIRDFDMGRFAYATSPGFLNPPWALLLLGPLGWLNPDVARGLLVVVTLWVTFEVMRDYRRVKISYLLAVISLPMLAVIWLGQLEVFALLGALIGYRAVMRRRPWWLAVALLFMLIKPQETWVIILFLLVGSIRRWTSIEWAKIGIPVILVMAIASLWLGSGWISRLLSAPSEYASQWQNFSVWQWGDTLPRGVVMSVWGVIAIGTVWALRRAGLTRLGLAVAAVSSNLLSPYLTGPHLLMTLCFGWGLLFDLSTRWGIVAYVTSLTPLLRIASGDQGLNRLDLGFPLVVFVGLLVQMNLLKRQQHATAT